jgi:hypothetical protein
VAAQSGRGNPASIRHDLRKPSTLRLRMRQKSAGSRFEPLPDVRSRAVRLCHRSDQGAQRPVIHQGYIVAEWDEFAARVDMTHSVTKSRLSSVIGVAYDAGMIRDINDTVQNYMAPVQAFSPLVAGNKSDRLGPVPVRHAPQSHHHMGSHARRPATRKARCAASPTGPTGWSRTPPSGRRGRVTGPAPSINTTTCG